MSNVKIKMASVNISLTEEAYRYLKMLKGRDKSFSEVVLEIKKGGGSGTGKDLLKFAGILKNVDWAEKEKNKKEFREEFNKRVEKVSKYMEESRKK